LDKKDIKVNKKSGRGKINMKNALHSGEKKGRRRLK
jgi:hypothetical protein